MTSPGPDGTRHFDRSLLSTSSSDPLTREIRDARKEGSTIAQIARIWSLTPDEVRDRLRTRKHYTKKRNST